MRAAAFATLVCLSAPAAVADPAPGPAPRSCDVTISRAPDEVRDAIEKWVRVEPRCGTSLDVRAVPTDGGVYLLARTAEGRVYERVVPDAQSAGVLVASWVADDSVAWAPPAREPYAAAAAPVAVAAAPGAVAAAPVAVAPSHAPAVAVRAASPRRAPSWRWIGVSALTEVDATDGEYADNAFQSVRLDLDLLRIGSWNVGLMAMTPSTSYYDNGSAWMNFEDARGGATVSRTLERGAWYLRLQGGIGMLYSRASGEYMYDFETWASMSASGFFAVAEGGAAIGRVFLRDWALDAGALAAWRVQTMKTPDDLSVDRGVQSSLFLGVRRRL